GSARGDRVLARWHRAAGLPISDPARLSSDVRHALHFHAAWPAHADRRRYPLYRGRPAHRLRGKGVTLSPITRRRLAIFRQHRRGYLSFWIFLVLFVASLFAEFIANDRPLVIYFNHGWYFPILQDYSEDTFGPGLMPTEADYTDPVLYDLIN